MKFHLLSALAGSLYALAFPFKGDFNFFPFILISATIYFSNFFDKEFSLKKTIISTLLFVWAYNLTGYYWLTFTLQEFGGLFFPFNYMLWQFFSLGIAPQFYVFILFFYFLRKYIEREQVKPYKTIILSLLWVLAEYYTPQQFPAHFGHPWLSFAPYLKGAQLFGTPFYSFLSVFIGMNIYTSIKERKVALANLAISLLLIISNFSLGAIEPLTEEERLNVRYVQANIGNDLKLKSEGGIQLAKEQVISIFKDFSTKESDVLDGPLDLILWPETAYPRYLFTKKIQDVPYDLKAIARKTGAELFLGTYDLAHTRYTSFEQAYNTILHVNDEEIKDIYHKRVLIPFGEGLPFGPLNPYLAGILKNISFFAEGQNFTFFTFKEKFKGIALICYEVLFPEYVRDYLNSSEDSPSLILNLTNDSWYGPYSEQEQHLFLAKWRSVEFNLPMLRSTNTGISSYILNNGLEVKRLGNFIQGNLDIEVSLGNRKATIYQKLGIFSFLMLGIVIVVLKFISLRVPLLKDRAF